MQEQRLAEQNLILKVITGSKLYGCDTPESDNDFQGIFVPPKQYVYGLHKVDQVVLNDKSVGNSTDYTCYNIIKFIQLAIANNPNILSILYTPKDKIIQQHVFGELLMKDRDLFLSKKAYHTYRGYAHAQRRKILMKEAIPESKRYTLIQQFGYDTKFASHLIRLLYEGIDIFKRHEIVYPSPHADLLLNIKQGKWVLGEVLALAVELEAEMDTYYEKSELQYSADTKEIEKLQMNILETFWNNHETSST